MVMSEVALAMPIYHYEAAMMHHTMRIDHCCLIVLLVMLGAEIIRGGVCEGGIRCAESA